MTERTEKTGFIDKLMNMDRDESMRLIIRGLILSIIFGTLLMTSRQINANANTWRDIKNQQNSMAYWDGEISYTEYTERQQEINLHRDYMRYQFVIFGNIFRALVNLALIFVVLGFIGLSRTHEDDKVRALSIMIAGVVLFVIMLTTMFSNIAITLT